MKKRILVIDDEKAIRDVLGSFVESMGFTAGLAESGEEGLEMMKEGNFHLVLLDLHMPGMDGVETLLKLRRIDRDVPVYIVTGFYERFLKELRVLREKGIAFEVLHKPVERNAVIQAIRGALGIDD